MSPGPLPVCLSSPTWCLPSSVGLSSFCRLWACRPPRSLLWVLPSQRACRTRDRPRTDITRSPAERTRASITQCPRLALSDHPMRLNQCSRHTAAGATSRAPPSGRPPQERRSVCTAGAQEPSIGPHHPRMLDGSGGEPGRETGDPSGALRSSLAELFPSGLREWLPGVFAARLPRGVRLPSGRIVGETDPVVHLVPDSFRSGDPRARAGLLRSGDPSWAGRAGHGGHGDAPRRVCHGGAQP